MSASIQRQFVSFALIGAIGTAGHYLTLITLVEKVKISPVIATTFGFVVGALINYILNYRFTFRSNKPHHEALSKFLTVALLGAGVNTGLMYLLNQWLGLHYFLAQLVATGLVLVLNFLLNRIWTFAESHTPS